MISVYIRRFLWVCLNLYPFSRGPRLSSARWYRHHSLRIIFPKFPCMQLPWFSGKWKLRLVHDISHGNSTIAVENHYFQWENPLFLRSFSSSQTVSHYQRVIPKVAPDFPRHLHPQTSHSTQLFSASPLGLSLAAWVRSANIFRKAQLTTKRNQPQQGKGLSRVAALQNRNSGKYG